MDDLVLILSRGRNILGVVCLKPRYYTLLM